MEIWEKGNPNFANCPGFNYCPIFGQFNFLDFIHNPTFWNTFLPSIIKLSKICKHFSILPKLASSELIARVDKCEARLSSCNLNVTPSTQTISPTLVYHLCFIEKHPILRIINNVYHKYAYIQEIFKNLFPLSTCPLVALSLAPNELTPTELCLLDWAHWLYICWLSVH